LLATDGCTILPIEDRGFMSIPTLSLIVAVLAVFFGPLISLWLAKRQIASSAEVANKQIIAPMRQAWINNLRDHVAELTGDALHYFTAGHDFKGYQNLQRLTFLESKIQLMLNPNEPDHQRLEWMIREMDEITSRWRPASARSVHRNPSRGHKALPRSA
jgi:hypothetical protein